MNRILGIDHVAITVSDLEAACRFYDRLFAAQTHVNYAPHGKPLVRQIALGGALLSVHQAGNGIELVARQPTIGSADICFRWDGSIASAIALLKERGVEIIEGPVPSPRDLLPFYPAFLNAIVVRCLQKNPDDRYQSARDLHSDLDAFGH